MYTIIRTDNPKKGPHNRYVPSYVYLLRDEDRRVIDFVQATNISQARTYFKVIVGNFHMEYVTIKQDVERQRRNHLRIVPI